MLTPILAVTFLLSPLTARPGNQDNSTSSSNTSLTLQLRLGNDRTRFHVGELIPVKLTFTSSEHKKYAVMGFECGDNDKYHVEPPLFLDRDTGMGGWACNGGIIHIDPGEKPFAVEHVLNSRFRMNTPGNYRISVTSTRLGPPVTSNTVEVEITPADPAWQESELHRALELTGLRTEQSLKEGCAALRYLETNAAAIAIAEKYADLAPCASFTDLDTALISAPNRADVLKELHEGIVESVQPVSSAYLRTIAIISLYQEHPDWYPQQRPATGSNNALFKGQAESNGLWLHREALPNREIYYAKELADALPEKTPEARAKSLETLLYLGRTLGYIEIPPEIKKTADEEIAANFRNLPASDQNYVLRQLWPDIKSPAMIPVLKEVVNAGFVPASNNWPQSVALRRLYELSPEEARPYILRELRSEAPRIDTDVLGLLPEKELPELDAIMLNRVVKSRDDGYRAMATALVQRYASASIAKELLPFMDQNIGNMTCESTANLLAYFLRAAPENGRQLLSRAMRARSRLSCRDNLLQRLATIHMSPEVEQAAIAALNDSDPSVAQEALIVLKEDGSADCKAAILHSFRQWHQQWEERAKDLNTAANARWRIDGAYFHTLAFAQAWLSSKEDLETLRDLCLTESCKQEANSALIWRSQEYVMIAVVDPVGDEIAERYMPGGTFERLKQKMAQYPKGTLFQIDARFKDYDAVQRFFAELEPWTISHGYLLQIYRD